MPSKVNPKKWGNAARPTWHSPPSDVTVLLCEPALRRGGHASRLAAEVSSATVASLSSSRATILKVYLNASPLPA
eukprot:3819749-Pyramimonas_sp.AAC.1